MNDTQISNKIHQAVDQVTKTAAPDPWLAQKVRMQAQRKEDTPVKKKISASLIIAIATVLLLTTVAAAITNGFGILDYRPEQSDNKALTDHIMSLGQVWDGEYFSMSLNEAVFDGMKMQLTMSFYPKENANPVFVIPRIGAKLNGQKLNTWLTNMYGIYDQDGFWLPCIEPDHMIDSERSAVEVLITDESGAYLPVSDQVEWNISFDVLHSEWPIEFTEQDEPMIGEAEWTAEDYDAYFRLFEEAYQSKKVLLNRAGMIKPYLDAIQPDPGTEDEMHFIDFEEALLTKEAFALEEKAVFSFTAEPLRVKTASKPVHFETPDGLVFDLQSLAVSPTEISLSFRISRLDGKMVLDSDFWARQAIAVLADHAITANQGGFMMAQDDGSQLYTQNYTINGETDKIYLIPANEKLFTQIMEQQTVPEQAGQVICVELE